VGFMARAATTSDAFNAVAEPRRREILNYLALQERPVGEIVDALEMEQPSVSKHLRVLKDAGLVFDQQIGNSRIYQLNPDGIESLRDYFDRFWVDALESFKAFAENTKPKKTNPQHATNKAKRPQSSPRKR